MFLLTGKTCSGLVVSMLLSGNTGRTGVDASELSDHIKLSLIICVKFIMLKERFLGVCSHCDSFRRYFRQEV